MGRNIILKTLDGVIYSTRFRLPPDCIRLIIVDKHAGKIYDDMATAWTLSGPCVRHTVKHARS